MALQVNVKFYQVLIALGRFEPHKTKGNFLTIEVKLWYNGYRWRTMTQREHDVMPKHGNDNPFKHDESFVKRIEHNLKIITIKYIHAKQDKEMLKLPAESGQK